MQRILFEYEMHPTTWVYVSSLLIIGIYFKFHRFWSVRNLDLLGLIAFAPGLLMVARAQQQQWEQLEQWGYVWLFSVGGLFLIRLLLDPLMVRRPLLEPNLSAGGLTFTGVALLAFLMTNVITGKTAPVASTAYQSDSARRTPGLFYVLAGPSSGAITAEEETQPGQFRRAAARATVERTSAVLGHLALVIAIVLIGYRHFDNIHTGVAAASLYLLLPYTAQMTPLVDHVLPGALLVWGAEAYRRPAVAGAFVGLAAGLFFFPLFLLPLWCSFYWRRGLIRFAAGVVLMLLLLVLLLAATSQSFASFAADLPQMFGWTSLSAAGADGFWKFHEHAYRIPVLAAFLALSGSLALWPAQKNFGTLLSCSAAVILATQFCHADQGGIYMAWYLPLLVLTIFRPNLEDRMASTAVSEARIPRLPGGRLAST